MTAAPWDTALGALDVFERVVLDYEYLTYARVAMRGQRLQEIYEAKQWIRNQRDNQREK